MGIFRVKDCLQYKFELQLPLVIILTVLSRHLNYQPSPGYTQFSRVNLHFYFEFFLTYSLSQVHPSSICAQKKIRQRIQHKFTDFRIWVWKCNEVAPSLAFILGIPPGETPTRNRPGGRNHSSGISSFLYSINNNQ